MLDKEEVLRVLQRMGLKYYEYAEIKKAIDSIQEIRTIPISFITTQILKQQKLVDYERYENDEYDGINYHKLLALNELLEEIHKYEADRRR